jgi:hypothetical protein
MVSGFSDVIPENDYSMAPIPSKGNHSKKKYFSKQHIHIVTRKHKYERGTLTKISFGDFK